MALLVLMLGLCEDNEHMAVSVSDRGSYDLNCLIDYYII